MRCPECGHEDSKVVDSRSGPSHIRRRRECLACASRFTTHERMETPALWIMKKNGQKEPFNTNKLLAGLSLACRKRPIDAEIMEEAVQRVHLRLLALRQPTVPSSIVGEVVMEVLERWTMSRMRFASVYRAFESVDQFVDAIQPLQEGN